jgi:hypothetical protein
MGSRAPTSFLVAAGVLAVSVAQAATPAPPFDVAYRAWELVTELSRHNRQPELTGSCGKTFQPYVVPALRRQTREEQDAAATACVSAARESCAAANLQRTPEITARCREFPHVR